MRTHVIYKIVTLFLLFLISTGMVSEGNVNIIHANVEYELLYDNIWGSIYHPVKSQCDNTPTITGDGSRINPHKASELRWIAISHEMLNSEFRANIVNDPDCKKYKGKIKYGDTILIVSPHSEINGYWIVHDTKNKRYRKSIDFLQTKNDSTLYNNDPTFTGRFDGIKIFKIRTKNIIL